MASDTIYLSSTSCLPSEVGVATATLTNENGCDSLVITTTTLLQSDTTYQVAISDNPSDTGTTTTILTNENGCDSLLIVTTTLTETDTTYLNAGSCNPVDTGVATTVVPNQYGADSVILITTTSLLASDTIYLTSTSCNINEVGIATATLTNANGCDSLVITTTTLLQSDTTYQVLVSGNPSDTGTTTTILTNENGCDSLLIVTTTLTETDTTYLNAGSCNPVDTGVATTVLANQYGADSVILITTTSLLASDTVYLSSTSCLPSEVGVATATLTNENGCDSLVITTTTLLQSDTTYLINISCNPADTGVVTQVLTNMNGCDSLVVTTTNLAQPIISNISTTDITDCGLTDATITINATSSIGANLEFSIDSGSTWQASNSFAGLGADTYYIFVRNADSTCMISYVANPVTIIMPTAPIISNVTSTNPQFCGINDGYIGVTATGIGSLEFSIDSGSTWTTQPYFTGLAAGIYYVMVRNIQETCEVEYGTPIVLGEGPVADTDYHSSYTGNVGCVGETTIYTLINHNGQSFANYVITPATGWTIEQFVADTLVIKFSSTSLGTTDYNVNIVNINGCVYTDSISIVTSFAPQALNAGNDIFTCQDSSVILSATNGFVTYEWRDSLGQVFTGNNISIATSRSTFYTLAATDVNGCIARDTVNVSVLSNPNVVMNSVTPSTCDATDGSITFNVVGNAAKFEYSINNGATWQLGNTFTGLGDGVYYPMIQYFGAINCPMTLDSIVLDNQSAPTLTGVNSTNVSDCNLTNGTITINASAATGNILEYSIDSGSTWQASNVFSNLSAGTYYIYIRNNDGNCITEYVNNPVIITAPTAPIISSISETDPQFCGINDGFIGVTATGIGQLEYSIDSGSTWTTQPYFSGLSAGIYTILVRNADGSCTVQYGQSITLGEGPVADTDYHSSYTGNVGCVGETTIYTLINHNGQSFANYTITPATGWTIEQYVADTLRVKFTSTNIGTSIFGINVQNVNGCVYKDTVTIVTSFAAQAVNAGNDIFTCQDSAVTLSATNGFVTYEWRDSLGQVFTGNNISVATSQSTFYQLTATDANGCVAKDTIMVNVLSNPTVVMNSVTPSTCDATDGSITFNVVGNAAKFEYSINNGATWQFGNTFTGLGDGVYYPMIQYFGAINCPMTLDSIVLDNQSAPTLTGVSSTNSSDCNLTDGTITINANAATGNILEYSIDSGSTWQASNVFSNLSAGTYYIFVRNNDGNCTIEYVNNPVILTAPAAPIVSNVNSTNPQFCGISDGFIGVTATGTGALQFSIDSGSTWTTAPYFSGLIAGTYHIFARNIDGSCATPYGQPIILSEGPVADTDYGSTYAGNVGCVGDSTLYTLVNHNGQSFATYAITPATGWSMQQFAGDTMKVMFYSTNLSLHRFDIEITNINGCVYRDSVSFTPQFTAPTVDAGDNQTICENSSTILSATSGFTNYTWTDGNGQVFTGNNISVTPTQTTIYTVTATNANGCIATDNVQVKVLTIPIVTITSDDPSSCNSTDGKLTFTVAGATDTIEYSVNNGATWQLGNVFSSLPSGVCYPTVRYKNLPTCLLDLDSLILDSQAEPTISTITSTDLTDCATLDGTITINASSAVGNNLEYSIDSGSIWQSSAIFTGLAAGSYYIMVRNDDGNCLTDDANSIVVLTAPTAPSISAVTSTDPQFCNINDGFIQVTASGVGALQYSIDGGSTWTTAPAFSGLAAGAYQIMVRNMGGTCVTPYSTILTLAEGPIAITDYGDVNLGSINCHNDSMVYQLVNFNGASFNSYTITPNNGWTVQSFSADTLEVKFYGVNAGQMNYHVEVVNTNQCIFKDTVTIDVNIPTVAAQNHLECLNATGIYNINGSLITLNGNQILPTNAVTYTSTDGTFANANNINTTFTPTTNNAGSYRINVAVTDANGCIGDTTFTLTVVDTPHVSIDDALICQGSSTTLQATPNYIGYQWTVLSGDFGSLPCVACSTVIVSPSMTTVYELVIENAAGCTATEIVTVTPYSLALVNPISTDAVSTCGICDGQMVVEVVNGVAPFTWTYTYNGITSTQTVMPNSIGTITATNLCAGLYQSVIISDALGCSFTSPVDVTIGAVPFVIDMSNFTITSPACNGSAVGSIVANGALTGAYNIFDNNNTFVSSVPNNNLAPGSYILKYINGVCTASDTFTITNSITWSVGVNISQNCANGATVTANVINPNSTYTYNWSTGATGSTLTNVPIGVYSVTVTDGNGCSLSQNAISVQPCTDTIISTINIGGTYVTCLDTSEIASIHTINSYSNGAINNGTFSIVNNGCLIYTGTMAGWDSINVVMCDATGLCDTTVLFLQVLPLSDTIYLTVPINNSTTYCIDGNQLQGTPTNITNIGCSTTSFAQSVTVSDTCMTYLAGGVAGAYDTICVVIEDAFGNFDTTIFIVNVVNNMVSPDTAAVVIPINGTTILCADISELLGVPTSLVNMNCAPTTFGSVTGIIGDSCIAYTAGSIPGSSDTVCVVVSDGMGTFDTTVFIITVTDVTIDTIIQNILVGQTTTICVDSSEFVGSIIGMFSMNCSPIDNGTVQNINNGCLTYQAGAAAGSDTICVIACDALGICDTTVMIINIAPTIDTLIVYVASGELDTTCIPTTELSGNVVSIVFCDMPDAGTANILNLIGNNIACVSYQTPPPYEGTDMACVIVCDDLGICDTTIIIYISSIDVSDVNCDTVDFLPNYVSLEGECGSAVEYCIPFAPSELQGYSIYIDGNLQAGLLQGCEHDTLMVYSLKNVPSSVQSLNEWMFNGTVYQLSSFGSYHDVVNQMNVWDPQGNWTYNNAGTAIVGGRNNTHKYGRMIYSTFVGAQTAVFPTKRLTPNGTRMNLTTGIHEVIIVNPLTKCADTATINVYCSNIDTTHILMPVNDQVTFCPDDSNLATNITYMFNYCLGGTGNGTFVMGSNCIDYTSGGVAGYDTLCIMSCDAFNNCDTTVYIITIVPTPEDRVIEIYYPNSDTICLPLNQLPGNITDIYVGDQCGEPSNATIDIFVPDPCIFITATAIHDDSTCIIYCDDQGFCDTLYLYIEIETTILPVQANLDSFIVCDLGNMAVLNNDNIPGGIDTLYVLDEFNTPYGGTLLVNFDNTITYTRVNQDPYVDSFRYVICNMIGCDTATVMVFVNCQEEVIVYTGFSPNGDGINDNFTILGIEKFPNNNLLIFNRWGNMVHSEKGYKNSWNGMWSARGKNLPDGTYFYVFEYVNEDGETKKLNGYVQIHR